MLPYAYGTTLQTNLPWCGLAPARPADDHLSICVDRVRELPDGEAPLNACYMQGRTVSVLGTAPAISIKVEDILLVRFDREARALHCLAASHASEQVIEFWLLRHMIPIARLIWGDVEILHAGAVRIGDEAVAFLAPSCTGKSTLVGHFVEQGHTLLSDDLLVLQRHDGYPGTPTWAVPAIPYYRNYRATETLGRHTTLYEPQPCRLRAIYVLKRAAPDSPVSVSALADSEAALELLHQAPYSLLSLRFPEMMPLATTRFRFVSALPASVPVRRLDVPRCLNRLREVEACILADSARMREMQYACV